MKNIRWGWILLGAVLAELAIFIVVIPFAVLVGEESLVYVAPAASLITTFASGRWVAGKALRRRTLHGTAVGIVAMAITLGMNFDLSIAYLIAHVLKVLGGAAGGFVASNRSTVNANPEPPAGGG